jgi:hypothetical protein
MMLSLTLLIAFCANIWLSWALGSWLGVGVFLSFIPVSLLMTFWWACALGLVGMLFGKHDNLKKIQRFFRHFLRWWWWLIALVWISPWLLFGFVQFSNNVAPATLPKITISNGEKTVIFQSMMHIGSPQFYDDIQSDMESMQGRDYVFFYEWVRPGTPESIEKLGQLMGMSISESMYQLFADIGWLSTQKPETFLGILPSTNIDLSTDEIIALAGEENIAAPENVTPNSLLEVFEKQYPTFNPLQKKIVRVMSRGMLNILLKTYQNPALTEELKKNIPVFSIILDKRNDLLADAITWSPVPNIYIHYGALHYAGVLTRLREKDSRWQEIARTEFQVIR